MEADIRCTDVEKILLERIGYEFDDLQVFRESLTHKSYSNEQGGIAAPDNERLEFLGDAVLDMVVSHKIFVAYPGLPEGELTRIRAEVVSEAGLAQVGRRLEVGNCLRLGRGELRTGGRDKDSLVANALEALIGAVYCDGGFHAVQQMVLRLFEASIDRSAKRKLGIDFKTRLQELMQARFGAPPEYTLIEAEG
ncbi:ribonuclease III, partial [Trichloromonas sp.]|uniref:ribonuclease III n=1 Tax=Trichloromonas sp. TaxID=3069249 RepID=UPI003D817FEB